MPSMPPDSGWDFTSAIDLIDSDVQDVSSPKLTPKPRPLASVLQEEGGIRLGSFAKLFENLGLAKDTPPLPPLDSESELSTSDEVLLPSPVLKAAQAPVKLAGTEDQIAATTLSKKQRQKARKKAEKEQQEELLKTESFQEELQAMIDAAQEARKSIEAASPSKPSRIQSRSNVSAKIRASSPVPLPKAVVPDIAPTSPQKLNTAKPPRPSILKRPSTAQSATPQLAHPVENVQLVQPTPTPVQYSTFGTPTPIQYPRYTQLQMQPSPASTPSGQHGLVPRTVRPVTLPRNSQRAVLQLPSTPTPVALPAPVYATRMGPPATFQIRSQVDRHFHLFQKLLNDFPDDRKWLLSPMQLISEKTISHGLHVFVDASNIMIGFKDMLRYHGIQPYEYNMSFDSLALLMERRRPVAKRVFAGSQREANPLPHVTKLVETSKAVGYDSVMQEQVLIVREDSEKKKFFNDVKKHGWHKATQLRSGSGSDSETGPPPAPKTPSAPKWVEQGVDEILHLKMCQSIIDTEVPSTMVLATGDGAEAEMSDGFLAHVERALKKGWRVELISWRQQTNGGYKNRKFRAKWAEQFQIIELDDFLEALIDTP
ncbi:hypothetical protein T440DRAFT_443525 [Plenodomus tracheiphilus IPT5]|uniref:NYN domain-containing protein n=1 Tax=Plenodomus tracheiphilus IPT5 TaxID=1408161 RepID=A0A6A7BHA0_9PLEO|nr:hypothetical protein T440DRAFT_443525 [Plenodomus tracheiphilus IPT5]